MLGREHRAESTVFLCSSVGMEQLVRSMNPKWIMNAKRQQEECAWSVTGSYIRHGRASYAVAPRGISKDSRLIHLFSCLSC